MKRILLFKAFFLNFVILSYFCPQQVMGMKLESTIKLEQNLAISLGDDKTNPIVTQFFPYWIESNVKDDGASFMKFFTKDNPDYLINWCLETLEKEYLKNNQAKFNFSDNKEQQKKDTLNYSLICDLSGILRGRFIYTQEDVKTCTELTQWVLKKLDIKSEIGLDKNDKLSEFYKDLCSPRTIKIKDASFNGVLVCTGYVTSAIDLFNKSLKEFLKNQPVMGMQNELLPCSKKLELDFAKSLGDNQKNESSLLLDKFFSNWDTSDVKDNGKDFTSFFTKQDNKDSRLITWFITSLKDKENKEINLDFSDNQDDTCLNYRLLGDFTGIFDNRFMYYDEKGKKNPAQEITPWIINTLEIKDCTIGLDKNDKLSQFFKDLCTTRPIEKELYQKSKNQKNDISTNTPQSFLVCKGYVEGSIEEINNILQKYKKTANNTPKKQELNAIKNTQEQKIEHPQKIEIETIIADNKTDWAFKNGSGIAFIIIATKILLALALYNDPIEKHRNAAHETFTRPAAKILMPLAMCIVLCTTALRFLLPKNIFSPVFIIIVLSTCCAFGEEPTILGKIFMKLVAATDVG